MSYPVHLDFSLKKMDVMFSGNIVSLSKSDTDIVSRVWAHHTADNPHFFNGEVFTIADHQPSENSVICLDKTDYKHYLATISDHTGQLQKQCQVVYTATLIETSDNKIAFGKMACHTSTPQRYQCVGGGLDCHDLMADGRHFNLLDSVKRELQEETGLFDKHIDDIHLYCTKTGGQHGFMALIFKARLRMDSAYLEQHFNAHQEKCSQPEFSDLIILDRTQHAIESFCDQNPYTVDYLIPLLKAYMQG